VKGFELGGRASVVQPSPGRPASPGGRTAGSAKGSALTSAAKGSKPTRATCDAARSWVRRPRPRRPRGALALGRARAIAQALALREEQVARWCIAAADCPHAAVVQPIATSAGAGLARRKRNWSRVASCQRRGDEGKRDGTEVDT
jgi:hypothetical protein